MDPLLAKGVALITGSGSGIGRDIALAFVRSGCRKLFLVDLSAAGLDETKAEARSISPEVDVLTHSADISDEDSVRGMIDECVAHFGRLDFAVNNAGVGSGNTPTHELKIEVLEKVIRVNARGTFLCQKYQLLAMLKQQPHIIPDAKNISRGSIVNIASLAGLSVVSGIASYGATKHGVVSMTRVDAREYAKEGIRINNVCPGYVDTPLMRREMSEEFLQVARNQSPMKRLVDPAEVANAVLFLSGSSATGISGVSLPVDCGALLYCIV